MRAHVGVCMLLYTRVCDIKTQIALKWRDHMCVRMLIALWSLRPTSTGMITSPMLVCFYLCVCAKYECMHAYMFVCLCKCTVCACMQVFAIPFLGHVVHFPSHHLIFLLLLLHVVIAKLVKNGKLTEATFNQLDGV